jgi:5-methylcytosine-specific restriction endonuclease McrA
MAFQKICEHCGASFTSKRRQARFCSLRCSGRANGPSRSAYYAAKRPTECTEPGCSNPLSTTTTRFRPVCGPCRVKKMPRLDSEQVKAHQRRKTHIRKARMRYADFTPTQERQMRAKAKRCPLCTVRLIEEPYRPASKELDHIVPLGVGGTHTLGNVRIICRSCNLARPKDGSDYSGPVTLFAMEVA